MSQKRSNQEDAGTLDSAIWALALPALGTELLDPLLSACDVAFVGRLGAAPLAGVGIASSVFTYTFLFFNFLSTALSPLVAQSLARCAEDAYKHLDVAGMLRHLCNSSSCGHENQISMPVFVNLLPPLFWAAPSVDTSRH
jgi:Na+-driven multidrug efflux pump